jgi:hypothetical protein
MIQYHLSKNPFSDELNNCVAKIDNTKQATREAIVKECCNGAFGVSPEEVESVLLRLEQVIPRMLLNGYTINTPLLNINPSITGVFEGWGDAFDPKRHSLHFRINPGKKIKETSASVLLRKNRRMLETVDVFGFMDHTNPNLQNATKASSVCKLEGKRIKFNEEDPKQGIFFIAEDNSEIRINIFVKNSDTMQIFQTPSDLPVGNYVIEIRCIPHNTKKMHIRKYEHIISVS